MKTPVFLLIVAAAIGLVIYARLEQNRSDNNIAAAAAKIPKIATPKPDTPVLVFGGRVLQHTADGLLVQCDEFIRALPKGYQLNDIQGDFLLIGHPDADNLADNTRIRFAARHGGLYHFTTVLNAQRSVRAVFHAGGG